MPGRFCSKKVFLLWEGLALEKVSSFLYEIYPASQEKGEK